MKVSQITIGRVQHFHLARQMERHGLLDCIWTGYPLFKLKDESGIPISKIRSYPWVQAPYMARIRFGLAGWKWLDREWEWLAHETLDKHVAKHLSHPTILIGLSGMGLHAGIKVQQEGGLYICDRASSHIRFQNEILHEEYSRHGLIFQGIDPRVIEKEELEYQQADFITVPSEFAKKSFMSMGVPSSKIAKVVYGANLERFHQTTKPADDSFRVLWVGEVSIRKGFFDLLEAFHSLKHPKKELAVAGYITSEVRKLLPSKNIDKVTFKGIISNQELPQLYSSSHVFVFPSIEDGFGLVQGEALACGCPVIATTNTGSSDLFSDGVEGFIVPIRSPKIICDRLQQLADDPGLRVQMSEAAIRRVKLLGGWNTYGDEMVQAIKSHVKLEVA